MSKKVGVEKKGLTQQQRIDRLAEWMGWGRGRASMWWHQGSHCCIAHRNWNPFTFLDDARLLLEKCKRDGLLAVVGMEVYKMGITSWLMSTAKQQTEAVELVAFPEENSG